MFSCVFFTLLVFGYAARQSVTFDYAWRHQMNDPVDESPVCETTFEAVPSGQFCKGLRYTPQGRMDAGDCMRACCAKQNCHAWVWAYWNQSTLHSTQCYLANDTNYQCKDTSGGGVEVKKAGTRKTIPAYPPHFLYAKVDFDDSAWTLVDVPHDSLINETYTQDGPWIHFNHASLPRNVSWYRKHFLLPSGWSSKAVLLRFGAIFHRASIWVNGDYVGSWGGGYSPVDLRLDKISSTKFGREENVIAVRADPSYGSGHWYEGGGLYRRITLTVAPRVHVVPDGIFAPSELLDTFAPTAEIANDGVSTVSARAMFVVTDGDGDVVGQGMTAMVTLQAGQRHVLQSNPFHINNITLWSAHKPSLYTMVTTVQTNGTNVDTVTTTIGFRKTRWDADHGLMINDEHVHLRGFSHHEDFSGVGVAVPERFNLYRAQALRALGGNTWRTSHNPYSPELYPLLDQLGLLVWDEARDYTWSAVQDMAALVRRDRNHPSVLIWSFCNEVECEQMPGDNATQFAFRSAVTTHDTTRPTSYNAIPDLSTAAIDMAADLHGFSHVHPDAFASYRAQHPTKPIVSSECCSCQTQRGENSLHPPSVIFTNFDGDCLQQQVAWSDNLTYVAGTLGVWTLMDYYGEPSSWPHVSSSFGQFDLTGYPKAHAHWYRAWWLCDVATTDAGRPTLDACYVVHVVEEWDDVSPPSTIHVFSNAPLVELILNGRSLGTQQMPRHGYAAFNVTFAPGTLIAVARSTQGDALANHTRTSPHSSAGLRLSLAIPTPETGTGTALIADGHDAALLRVAVVDDRGVLVSHATDMVRFRVVSGPGLIVGVGNGDPSCHEHNRVAARSAYHGVASVMVKVTLDCTTANRDLLRHIDVDSNSSNIMVAEYCPASLEPIVVEATALGLSPSNRVSVPVSDTLSPILAARESLSDPTFDLLASQEHYQTYVDQ